MLLSAEPAIERALIGRLLLGYKGQSIAPPVLAPSRFSSPRHRLIWAVICDQARKGLPHDPVSVCSVLSERGELENSGGRQFIGGLLDDAGPETSLEFYASRIKACAATRMFGPLGKAISELALKEPDTPEASVKARYQSLVRRGDAICDMTARNGHQRTVTTQTIHQILTTASQPLQWLYKPWLCQGDIVVLAGEPGLGKSWVALDLMFALALKRPFLGQHPSFQLRQRVLYLDEENSQRLVRYRIGRIVDGLDLGMRDIDPAACFADYAVENNICLDDESSLELLKRKIEHLRPDWVIVDSLVRVHRRDENSNADMSALIGGIIKPMVRAVGAGAIIIHHLAKPSKERPAGSIAHRIRGASDIMGVADQVWGLGKVDDVLQLSHIKCRMGPESDPITAEISDVNGGNGVQIVAHRKESSGESS